MHQLAFVALFTKSFECNYLDICRFRSLENTRMLFSHPALTNPTTLCDLQITRLGVTITTRTVSFLIHSRCNNVLATKCLLALLTTHYFSFLKTKLVPFSASLALSHQKWRTGHSLASCTLQWNWLWLVPKHDILLDKMEQMKKNAGFWLHK